MLRWLQIGTAATGLSVALLATPAIAAADDGSSSAHSGNTSKTTDSHRGAVGTAKSRSSTAKSAPTAGPAKRSTTKQPDSQTVVSHDSAAVTGSSAAASDDIATPAVPTNAAVRAKTQPAPLRKPIYPQPVGAPVTVRSILTEPLAWLGLGDLPPRVPIPAAPVPDLIAAAWVGVRRFHYMFFNSTPTLTSHPYTQDPDTGVITGDVDAHDVDGDVVQYRITRPAAHGYAAINQDGTYTYTPDATFAHAGGVDTFTITVKDSMVNPWHIHTWSRFVHGVTEALYRLGIIAKPTPFWHSETITVGVAPVNHAPEVTATIGDPDAETGVRVITTSTSDSDGDTVTLTAGTPGHGMLTDNGDGTYTYAPATAYAHTGGTDTVTLTATDGHGATTTSLVTITVDPINHAPTVSATVGDPDSETGVRVIFTTTSDSDGDTVTVTASGASHGTLTDNGDGTYTYTPGTAYAHSGGTDSVTLTATDSYGASTQTSDSFGVGPINHSPTVSATAGTADPNSGVRVITVTTSDSDGDSVSVAAGSPSHGTLTDNGDGTYTYTPDTAYAHTGGTDSVTFTATDSYGAVTTQPLGLIVAAINHAPTVTATVGAADPDTGVRVITPVASDSDGDSMDIAVTVSPEHGTLIDNGDGTYTYTPETAYAHTGGTDTVTFGVTDSYGAGSQSQVSFGVGPINHAPTVSATAGTADPDSGVRVITVTTSDSDGDGVTVTAGTPNHGTLVDNGDGTYTYTPDAGFAHTGGTEAITFTAEDSYGAITTQPLNVTTAAINHAPTLTAVVGTANSATGVRLITPAVGDVDGDTVTISVKTEPAHGTLTDNGDGTYTYTPSDAYATNGGPESLTFTAADSFGATADLLVAFTVAATRANTAPDQLSLGFNGTADSLRTYIRNNQPTAPTNPAGPRSALTGGNLFLGGNFIEIGLSSEGSFGTTGVTPAGFFGAPGETGVGLGVDVDGYGTGTDSRIDYFLPGSPEERWSVGYNGTEYGGFSARRGDNTNTSGLSNVTLSNTSSGNTLSGSFGATVGGVLQTTQVQTFNVNDSFFQTTVTLTNTGDSTLTNVEYMRSFDPDNTVDQGGAYTTINTIRGQIQTDGIGAVSATSLPGDPYNTLTGQQATILYLTQDPDAIVYTGGFANSNPYAFDSLGQATGHTVTKDEAIGIIYRAGDLAPGQSATFTYYTALATESGISNILNQIKTPTVSSGVAGAQVAAVTGHDPDAGDTLTYSVSDPRFEVVNSGGSNVLKLKDDATLDYSTEQSVSLTVTGTDTAGATISKSFVVNVVNDAVSG